VVRIECGPIAAPPARFVLEDSPLTNCPPGPHEARLREPAWGPYLARFFTDEPPNERTLGPTSSISAKILSISVKLLPRSRLWGRPRLVPCVPAMFLHIVPTTPILQIVPTRRAHPARPPRSLSLCHASRCGLPSARCLPSAHSPRGPPRSPYSLRTPPPGLRLGFGGCNCPLAPRHGVPICVAMEQLGITSPPRRKWVGPRGRDNPR